MLGMCRQLPKPRAQCHSSGCPRYESHTADTGRCCLLVACIDAVQPWLPVQSSLLGL